jgi:hypothetical protein
MRLGTEQAGLGRSERFWTQKNSHKMFQDWMRLTTCCARPATGTRLRCRLVPLHAPDAPWKSRLAASVVNRFHYRGESTAGSLNQSMIGALFGAAPLTLGEAALAAKQTVDDLDVRRTRILFGDPAIEAQAGR